jgi:7,8-dihydropterin-6-yl-methyl-4-(beta-D-ribofuranosyl)aminobenzene 5'-phosphate synthase
VAAVPCRAQDRVTILYDAFSETKDLTKDWGFSALVEHDGKRILFDTGNNATNFQHNAKTLGVDLTKLDFVVV